MDTQESTKPVKAEAHVEMVMYPRNCIVIPRKDALEMLKTLEGIKKKLDRLLLLTE